VVATWPVACDLGVDGIHREPCCDRSTAAHPSQVPANAAERQAASVTPATAATVGTAANATAASTATAATTAAASIAATTAGTAATATFAAAIATATFVAVATTSGSAATRPTELYNKLETIVWKRAKPCGATSHDTQPLLLLLLVVVVVVVLHLLLLLLLRWLARHLTVGGMQESLAICGAAMCV